MGKTKKMNKLNKLDIELSQTMINLHKLKIKRAEEYLALRKNEIC